MTSQVDLLRAARAFAPRVHRSLDRQVLVTGFSQGGAAAMALGSALQHGVDPRLRLTAAAPISGPYALASQELPAVFDGRLDPTEAAYYLAYLTTSWNRTYHLYARASDVFAAPDDRTVAPLYDGVHDDDAIFAALPTSPQELFTHSWLAQLQHPTGRLAAALRANSTSCTGWRPAPVHIFAARGDKDVAIGNARACRAQLARDGVSSTLTDVGDVRHPDSGRRGLAGALRWFERIAPAVPYGR